MTPNDIKTLVENYLKDSEVEISGDGHHFSAVVICDQFEGKTLLERQRMVYAALYEHIASGELHALSFKTYTREQQKNKEK